MKFLDKRRTVKVLREGVPFGVRSFDCLECMSVTTLNRLLVPMNKGGLAPWICDKEQQATAERRKRERKERKESTVRKEIKEQRNKKGKKESFGTRKKGTTRKTRKEH